MLNELIDDCLPVIRKLKKDAGRYSVTIGGSRGKNLSDGKSDVDFRLYADEFPEGAEWEERIVELRERIEYWETRGRKIDGVWMRKISAIDASLDKWLSGEIVPEPLEWAVWGYYLPTDIYNQQIIEDPDGVAREWKERMTPYPRKLRDAVIKKHLGSLKYWKTDYHYNQKVDRKDVVFLASISARLIHDIMQVLFAVNGVYFPGDGHNISLASNFAIKPDNFVKRVETILYPACFAPDVAAAPAHVVVAAPCSATDATPAPAATLVAPAVAAAPAAASADIFLFQYNSLCELIDDVALLVEKMHE